jgi:hypothetical protein
MINDIERLKNVIRQLHGCESRHLATVPVTEKFKGEIVWTGDVEKFALDGHPSAKHCYAWSYIDDSGVEHFTATLEIPPVVSAETAVRAAVRVQVRGK